VTPRHSEHRLIAWGVAALLIGVVALWTLYAMRGALLVIYVSLILAIGFSPIVAWLEEQRWLRRGGLPRWVALLVVYFGGLLVGGVLIAIVLPPLVSQAVELGKQVPRYLQQLQQLLARYHLLEGWTVTDLFKAGPEPAVAVTGILGALQGAIGAVGTIVVIVVLPYYLLLEADTLQQGLLKLFPAERRPWVARMTHDATVKVGAWLNGQLLLGGIIGVSASVGLWLLGVPFFYVLGLIAAVGEFVPIIGPIVAAVPAILVGWTVSFHTALFVLAFFSVQQFIEGNILVPRIMQRQVGVSAWVVIVALLIGSELLGVIGVVLAVPTAAIIQVFFQAYLDRDES
jgi:predicted PurR-regulated permease PerM